MLKTTIFLTGRRGLPVLLTAWLLCGTLDILAAFGLYSFILHKATMLQVLQHISSAVYGNSAYRYGWYTGLAGLAFHYLIAGCFTLCYLLFTARYPPRGRAFILYGILYGLVVWAVMNLVVLPMSRLQRFPQWPDALFGILVLIFLFALPLAVYTHRYFKPA
ncbi:MAG TPA: hypothetical protein VGC22_14445 [Chitinophaga sp.]